MSMADSDEPESNFGSVFSFSGHFVHPFLPFPPYLPFPALFPRREVAPQIHALGFEGALFAPPATEENDMCSLQTDTFSVL